ncbi:MAG: HD domain-containing protein [Candidatus Magasanikbacteria bacterium]|nr:HD domain-containing protein [Candidatus Magasanikbacteria bacterium]
MITPELIAKCARYVQLKLAHEPAGHDWFHVERVWKMGKRLQATEGGDLFLVELAALLHNLGDHNFGEFNEEKGMLALFGMMDILEIEEADKEQLLNIVTDSKYKGDETTRPRTLEGKIVQDANWLDVLGAIGIARTFAAGGFVGRPIFDPDVPVRPSLSKQVYQRKKREGTSINSFYEKAFRLPERLNTETAKRIAEARLDYINSFLAQFMKEWEGADWEEILRVA